ncbi:DENN domain-containing protein 5B [Sesamum angolense]|uniref:DENN domain-containing protein 5B n=1 Tax=Sesamum angolense TaxID=2727404 RepID=A0AAE2BNF0_9LAMI|nr:DENN domain-containing protein 5B [Sesamum angolense]
MEKDEDSGSPGWSASFFMQTTEDVARAVAAAAAAVHSPRPSVIYSSRAESSSQLQRLQHHVSRILKGLSSSPEVKSGPYNPEILTSQKRQWASFQLQSLDHRVWKEPSKLFESMVVVGLPPSSDIQALQNLYSAKRFEGSGRFRSSLGGQHQPLVEPTLEPQVLFVYPPEKTAAAQIQGSPFILLSGRSREFLALLDSLHVSLNAWKVRADLQSIAKRTENTDIVCSLTHFRRGIIISSRVWLISGRSTSADCLESPANLLASSLHSLHFHTLFVFFSSPEHLKQSDLSFVFRLQVADDSTLYGCCVLAEEIIQNPSGLISMISEGQPRFPSLSRRILTTHRCYCILSRLPFFDLHFGVLNSIFTEERLERLTKQISYLDLESPIGYDMVEMVDEKAGCLSQEDGAHNRANGIVEAYQSSTRGSISGGVMDDMSLIEHKLLNGDGYSKKEPNDSDVSLDPETPRLTSCGEPPVDNSVNDIFTDKQSADRRLPSAVLPLLRYQQCESSESSSSFQGSPSEDRHFRSDIDEAETEEGSSSGQDIFSEHSDILEWAKANNHGSLQIICEYYQLSCPARGSTIKFQPLDHLHPLEYHRPDETVLHIAGSTIDLRSCNTSLELAEAHSALMVEEEAAALSVLTLFAGALLEKIVVVCANLGILSALVLSLIPLIRPFQWQSLLMPVLPNDMLDFLDAPVPYIVGVKNKTNEVQSKLTNVILVDANKNQVKSPTIPQLPQHRELYSRLSSYHAKLVGESYLGKKRPVYECTDVQAEAAKGFLGELRLYLDSLCSSLRSHTITNVQSNDDKVSLLLKESFIESFPSRDRPFVKAKRTPTLRNATPAAYELKEYTHRRKQPSGLGSGSSMGGLEFEYEYACASRECDGCVY